MSKQVEVPDCAVEILARRRLPCAWEDVSDGSREFFLNSAREDLKAAEPALRKLHQEELLEQLAEEFEKEEGPVENPSSLVGMYLTGYNKALENAASTCRNWPESKQGGGE